MDAKISARFTGPIASAVAGEVTRLSQHPSFSISEGVAYKAAWDRLAPGDAAQSPAMNLCESFRRDCLLMDLGATAPAALRELIGETFV